MSPEDHEHDRGLEYDLNTLLSRRMALGLFAGVGVLAVAGCGTGSSRSATATTSAPSSTSTASTSAPSSTSTASTSAPSSTSTASASAQASNTSCSDEIPEETAGPYPGDGSNGPNVLTTSGIVRSDITTSFGSASGVAKGIPLTIKLTIQDAAKSCAALADAAVYLWHCDIDGNYSLYSQAVSAENYLRGVQQTDANGTVTFTSIFPAAYSGRWPHIHFEVYRSLAEATAAGQIVATSQLALPEDVCKTVYATDGYTRSVQNLAQSSLASDNVFGDDDGVRQLATVAGSVSTGYLASLTVPV
jgi:protocatechuate 3,4-dioxygenase beta subunit